jgi:hypothetical protein
LKFSQRNLVVWSPQAPTVLPQVFYVPLWVGLVAVSLIVGPVWRVLSPARSLYRLLRRMIPCSRRLISQS